VTVSKKGCAEIPFRAVRENGGDIFILSKQMPHFKGCAYVGTGRNSYEETLLT
jgi:hypothetical protein